MHTKVRTSSGKLWALLYLSCEILSVIVVIVHLPEARTPYLISYWSEDTVFDVISNV